MQLNPVYIQTSAQWCGFAPTRVQKAYPSRRRVEAGHTSLYPIAREGKWGRHQGHGWAILTAYQIDAYQLTQFIRLGHVPVPVRQIDENTIVYAPAEGPFAVRVRLIHRGDPWFQSIDPALYRQWAEKISAEIESALVLTAQQYATWNEALLMTLR
jgi:hypothetical protein